MSDYPGSLARLLSLCRPCFTAPTFATFCGLCRGFLACVGEHTVTGTLVAGRCERVWHHSRAHDFFARARWSPDGLGLCLLDFLVSRFLPAGAPLVLVVDDTVFPRFGRKVFGAHLHRQDHVPGGGKQVRFGNCWVVLGLVLRLPFAERPLCLPLLFRLWQADPARRGYGRRGHPKKRQRDAGYPSQSELARQLVELVRDRHPSRQVELLGDGAYATRAMRALPTGVRMIARLKSSATLYDFPGERRPGQRGRTPLKGTRLGRVRELAEQPATRFEAIAPRAPGCPSSLHVSTLDCLWFGVLHAQPVRVVIVRDPKREQGLDLALVSTDTSLTAEQIIEHYAQRWTIEIAFRDAKQLTGVGEARNRTRRAVERTVPFGFLCQTLAITWYALNGNATDDVYAHRLRAPWYRHKRAPSYQDMLVALRRAIIASEFHREPPTHPEHRKITHPAQQSTLAAA